MHVPKRSLFSTPYPRPIEIFRREGYVFEPGLVSPSLPRDGDT